MEKTRARIVWALAGNPATSGTACELWAPVFPGCHPKSMSLYGGVPRSKFSSGHLTHGCGLLLPTRERAGRFPTRAKGLHPRCPFSATRSLVPSLPKGLVRRYRATNGWALLAYPAVEHFGFNAAAPTAPPGSAVFTRFCFCRARLRAGGCRLAASPLFIDLLVKEPAALLSAAWGVD